MMASTWLHHVWRAGISVLLLVALLAGCSSISKPSKSPPGYNTQSSRNGKNGSLFGSLFHRKPDPPQTIEGFMKQPRLDP
jgi:hypothetical protein